MKKTYISRAPGVLVGHDGSVQPDILDPGRDDLHGVWHELGHEFVHGMNHAQRSCLRVVMLLPGVRMFPPGYSPWSSGQQAGSWVPVC